MSDSPNPTAASGAGARQLLGMKGASGTSNIWKIRLQLMKPVTWIPLIWGVLCGAAASGNFHWTFSEVGASIACMLMSGPLLAGYTQTINDYYDREIDAINEPYRPIPSGAIPLWQVKAQIWILLLAGLGVAYGLDLWAGHSTPVVFLLALGGSFVSFIYSAPPLKLKQNGWLGNYALGASYIALPWWAGQALFGQLTWTTALLTLVFLQGGAHADLPALDYLTFLDKLYLFGYVVATAEFWLFVWGSNLISRAPEAEHTQVMDRINRVDLIYQITTIAGCFIILLLGRSGA